MAMLLSPTNSCAQTPTKQETIDWIKEKIHKNPGQAWHRDGDGDMDTIRTTINGNYITTTFISKVHRKRLIATETFSLYDIVFDGINDDSYCIYFYLPRGKIEYDSNIDGYGLPGRNKGEVQLAIYWLGEYDLMNRMIKALKNLSEYNKPHETY